MIGYTLLKLHLFIVGADAFIDVLVKFLSVLFFFLFWCIDKGFDWMDATVLWDFPLNNWMPCAGPSCVFLLLNDISFPLFF